MAVSAPLPRLPLTVILGTFVLYKPLFLASFTSAKPAFKRFFVFVHGDGKGHTGVFATLGTGPIYCKSSKQKSVTASTTESEIVALADGLPMSLLIRVFLIDQGYEVGPIIIH